MSTRSPLLVTACILLLDSAPPGQGPGDPRPGAFREKRLDGLLDAAEIRLRAIYDRGEFRGRRFRGEWLPDSSGYTVADPGRGGLVEVDVATGRRTPIEGGRRRSSTEGRRDGRRSPDGRFLLTYDGGDLHLRELRSQDSRKLTANARPDAIRYGGAVFSPDGNRIAFVESDSSRVRLRASLVPGDPSYPAVRETRFARVGGTIPSLRVGVVPVGVVPVGGVPVGGDPVGGGGIRWLGIEGPEQGFYLGQVEWAGNSDELLIEKLSRFRDEREFLIADLRSGAIGRIFHEKDPAWVVASYGVNSGLEWLYGGRSFLVITERDGWRHAYVHSRSGEQQALLTPGPFDIIERAAIDHVRGWFYFYASPDDAARKYLYRVALDGKTPPVRVTPGDQPGTHEYRFSPDRRWAFHTWASFDRPPVTDLVELPGHRVVRVLEDNRVVRDRAAKAGYRPTEFLRLPIGEGITLDAWLMKPKEFDASKKYPVLVYVYSEPHAQTVLDDWGRVHADYHRLISDLGYLVVSIDSRGTPAPKGAAWRRAVFGSLGPLSTREQAAALRELGRTRSFVDLSRVAIWGWSGGGSNTLNAMFREPDTYHVGIAVAAKPQPHLYNAWFQEIYMRTPEVNPEGYRQSAPIHFAEGLKGDLLIIHGTGERNTHLQIIEGLVDRLIGLGKRFDYFTYPNRRHGLQEGQGTPVHLRMLMVRYLLHHLPR